MNLATKMNTMAGYNRTFMEDPNHATDEYFASTGGKVKPRKEVRRQMSLVGEGVLGGVRHQGNAKSCGHVVASETVAASFKREKALLGIDEELPILAPQNSMDCMFNYRRAPGSEECEVATYDELYTFYQSKGVFEEIYYPYTGLPGPCKEKSTCRDVEKGKRRQMRIARYERIDKGNYAEMVKILNEKRIPLATSIVHCDKLKEFEGKGLYVGPPRKANETRKYHAVLLCGEGELTDGTPYFQFKNSYGTTFGYKGYALTPHSEVVHDVYYPVEPYWLVLA